MKLKWLRLVTICSTIIFFSLSGVVAAKYYSGGYSFDVVDYNTQSAMWFTENGEEYWNDSRAKTRIGQAPGSINPIYLGEYSYNWLGQYRPGTNSFTISLNSRRLLEYQRQYYPNSSYWEIGTNTMVHEFGHALHLGHPDNHETAGDSTIMGYSRDRTNHWPRYADIENLIQYRGY